jgi:hypothetical protein
MLVLRPQEKGVRDSRNKSKGNEQSTIHIRWRQTRSNGLLSIRWRWHQTRTRCRCLRSRSELRSVLHEVLRRADSRWTRPTSLHRDAQSVPALSGDREGPSGRAVQASSRTSRLSDSRSNRLTGDQVCELMEPTPSSIWTVSLRERNEGPGRSAYPDRRSASWPSESQRSTCGHRALQGEVVSNACSSSTVLSGVISRRPGQRAPRDLAPLRRDPAAGGCVCSFSTVAPDRRHFVVCPEAGRTGCSARCRLIGHQLSRITVWPGDPHTFAWHSPLRRQADIPAVPHRADRSGC